MKRRFSSLLGLLGVVLCLALAFNGFAQEKKAKAQKLDRLSGVVRKIDKDTSTITLGKGNQLRYVVYSADTKITFQNAAASPNELKENVRVICLGKFDEKGKLVAQRIDIRQEPAQANK